MDFPLHYACFSVDNIASTYEVGVSLSRYLTKMLDRKWNVVALGSSQEGDKMEGPVGTAFLNVAVVHIYLKQMALLLRKSAGNSRMYNDLNVNLREVP